MTKKHYFLQSCKLRLQIFLVSMFLIPVIFQCSGKKPRAPWPPAGDPTFNGLYPYNFADQSTENIKDIKRILTAGKYNKEKEDLYLFAFGRSLLDCVLYASLLQPAAQKTFLKGLGNILDLADMESMDDVFENKGFFKEPFFFLAKKHPKSPYATSAVEFNRIISILESDRPTWLAVEPSFNFAPGGKVLSLGYERDVAFSLKIFSVFEEAAYKNQNERTAFIIRSLLPYAFPNPVIDTHPNLIFEEKDLKKFIFEVLKPVSSKIQEESDPVTFALKVILEWMHGKLDPAMNSNDPLTLEIKHMLVKKHKTVKSIPLNSQVALTYPLPALENTAGLTTGRFYPYTFITLGKNGGVRVSTEPFLTIDKEGSARVINEKSPYLWPGREVVKNVSSPTPNEQKKILTSLESAEKGVSELVEDDFYANTKKGRAVAIAAHRDLPVHMILPLMKILKKSYDSILLAAGGGDHIVLIPVEIRPNCPGEGTRLTISLEQDGIRLVDTSHIEKTEKSLGAPFGTSPVKTDVLANVLSTFADLGRPLVYLETSYSEGNWTWDDLVKIHAATVQMTQKSQSGGEVYFYLLPELSMESTFDMEGEDVSIASDPGKESIESLVLKGLYGELEKSEMDDALSGYISGMKLETTATVILNAARCWGGDYRERAAEALSKAEPGILAYISDYIGDESISDVVSSALTAAGKNAAPFVVKKLKSRDNGIWTGAWYILSNMPFSDTGGLIQKLLKDPKPEIRVRALKLLAQAGPPGGVPAIMDLIDDSDEIVRRWAIVSAGMLGIEKAGEKLIPILESETQDVELLADAIFALGLLEAHEIKDIIIDYAHHPEAIVRAAVALSLGNMGMREETLLSTLLALLNDKDPTVRANAANALAVYGDPDTAPMIESLLEDGSPEVREAAQTALASLGQLPSETGETPLDAAAIAESCEQLGPEDILRIAAVEGKDVFKCLAKLTLNKNPEIRKAAVEALGMRGDGEAEYLLKKRTKDKSKAVRKAAWKALKKLGVYMGKKKKKEK